MKKIYILLALTLSYFNVYSQGSSGGQQADPCGQAFTVHFSNTTSCKLGIWWQYYTSCTDHLIASVDVSGVNGHEIPYPVYPSARITHIVYKYETNFGGGDDNCSPSDCVWPTYLLVEEPANSGNFLMPTNMSFQSIPNGAIYCGWNTCAGLTTCVKIQKIGPTEYNIDFYDL